MMRRALATVRRRLAAPAMPPRPAATTTPEELVAELAARPSTSLSLHDMASDRGDALSAAQYTHSELPVRLAKQAFEIRRALGSHDDDQASGIAGYYEATLVELLTEPAPTDRASEQRFAATITRLLNETRNHIPLALAQAVRAKELLLSLLWSPEVEVAASLLWIPKSTASRRRSLPTPLPRPRPLLGCNWTGTWSASSRRALGSDCSRSTTSR